MKYLRAAMSYGQNLECKQVRSFGPSAADTALALAIMNLVLTGGKVRCHKDDLWIEVKE
jgi:hypothetical protein